MQNLLLQLFSVIRLHLSADLQHNPESHHPVRGEFCGRPYTCFRTKFTPYQFEPNLEDFANVILDMIDIVLVSMSAKYGLQTRPIFTWIPRSLLTPQVIVWASFSCKGITGPFFRHETVTINRYIALLKQFVAIQQALDN